MLTEAQINRIANRAYASSRDRGAEAIKRIIREEMNRKPYESGLDAICKDLERRHDGVNGHYRPIIEPLFELLMRAEQYLRHPQDSNLEQDRALADEIKVVLKLEE